MAIKILLRDTRLTQEEIGKRFGITKSSVSAIDRGDSWGSVPIETRRPDHVTTEADWRAMIERVRRLARERQRRHRAKVRAGK